ncbi:MAG: hypothetical protein JOY69_01620 [Candidatus Eremiobacteraeota bacterium]|nr:hypothetical protein [Candidatus Eremiobacteraeota bacterium]
MSNSRIAIRARYVAGMTIAAFITAGCGGAGGGIPATGASSVQAPNHRAKNGSSVSVLKQLTQQVVIGSAVDPLTGAQNPYGLAIAPVTNGVFTAGDLVICNFNSKFNTQGSGKSLVVLHPVPGSTPAHVTQNQKLLGCDALALAPDDSVWAAAMVGNDDAVYSPSGKLVASLTGKPFGQPWGQVYVNSPSGTPAIYESNAHTGTIVRINLGASPTFDVIGSQFPRNRAVPGNALAPSGLVYDRSIDTLYFADGQNDTVVAFKNVSSIPNGGVVAHNRGMTFSGPSAGDASIVYAGAPLNGPISMALLYNGNLVVGNTLDPAGTNLLIELSPAGQVLDTVNVDTGPGGALFGIVATGTSSSDAKVYFNDDNQNNVQVLEQ